jgi:hypothetical protein
MAKSTQEQLDELRLEREKLELEDLRDRVGRLRAEQQKKSTSHAQVEAALADYQRNQKLRQDKCSHRKGGRGYEGIVNGGQDSMYSIIKHRMPFGDIAVLCTRCQKIWRKGETEHKMAVSLPTDNEMSESSQFALVQN